MDRILLWCLLIIGIGLFLFSLRKPLLLKDTILIFLMKAYFSSFIGVIVVKEEMVEYPVRFLSKYFDASILFEYFLYPIMCIYLYQTTVHSRFLGIVLQCALYTAALTTIEVICEKYTDLVEYHSWTWMHSFITIFLLSLSVRLLLQLINKIEMSKV
ncbi:hypothetical protein J2S00_003543 [Caldalkalibacillus uzonensis]|uniref:Uncharacterized protein n=1 Tax=Caldalkalibacillus uzonensis TaxID=353224 RepID=A0ABU0CWB6_9BACI|nr:CBO0543 family protein [Caldalkalibacillus uzonensis]MDQ0340717.1 hypothetical protein [Caldalkalibacillus uzonensis]